MAAPRPGYQRAGSSIAVSKKTIILVAVGDSAIGAKIVQGLATLRSDFQVLLGCVETTSGEIAVSSMGAPVNVNPIQLDLSSDQSIDHAAKAIEQHFGRLDVLINNTEDFGADITEESKAKGEEDGSSEISPREAWRRVFDINVTGTVALTERMISLLEHSKAPRIVFTSEGTSRMSAAQELIDADLLPYTLSKAAINRMVLQYAKLKPEFKVNACHLEEGKLQGEDVDQDDSISASPVVNLVVETDIPSGTLTNSTGVVPW